MAIQKITAAVLGNNAVTAANVAAGTLSAADIADNSITAAKLSTSTFAIDSLTVNTSDLVVDTANSRVGIGTSSPARSLHIRSTGEGSSLFLERTSNYGFVLYNQINNTTETFRLGFVNNGTFSSDILVANESGKVGIGTSSPNELLTLYKSTAAQAATQYGNLNTGDGSGNGFIVGVESLGNGLVWQRENTYIRFGTNATERLRIDSSGNVGIGTDSPNLSSGASGSTVLTISATASAKNALIELDGTRTSDGDPVSYFRTFNNTAATPLTDIRSIRGASDTSGSLEFYTSNSKAMTIDSSQNVGIGGTPTNGGVSTAASPVLQIIGTVPELNFVDTSVGADDWFIRTSDGLGFGNSTTRVIFDNNGKVIIGGSYTPDSLLHVESADSTAITIQAGVNDSASLRLKNDAHDWDVNCQTNDKFAIFSHTDSTERLVILPTSGNVGIGTTTPSTRLTVRDDSDNVDNYILEIGNDLHATNTKDAWLKYVGGAATNDHSWTTGIISNTYRIVQLGARATAPSSGTERLRISSDGIDFRSNPIQNFQLVNYNENIISPATNGFAGFRFMGPSATGDWGYFLSYDGSDSNVYQNHGISLVTDAGPLSFVARGSTVGTGSTRNFIRFNTSNGSPTERMRIDKDGNITMPYQPKFHAYGAPSTSQNNYVVYPYTYVNDGNCYSQSNGRFTAPVTGVYLFFWSAIANTAVDVYRFYMYKNGSASITSSGNDIHLRQDNAVSGKYSTNGSRVQMLDLAANDYINIYFYADSGSSHYVGSDYVNFGGYLIG